MNVGAYERTVLEFAAGPCVNLREPPSTEIRDWLAGHIGAARFAVITAHDPDGAPAPPEENARAEARLRRRLDAMGLGFRDVVGRSPDGSHRERSVAVAMACEQARALGAEFAQEAIFWFDGDAFWIVPCRGPCRAIRLPRRA